MSDKENVSIDTMMGNLKRRDRRERSAASEEQRRDALENGELVTRADGSKAIKVKSKKRRSKQPKKEEKSHAKRNLIFAGVLVLLLLLGGIGYTMLLAYYNGNSFRDKVVESVENATGAELELGSMEVSLTNAKANKAELRWDDSVLKSLKLENVYAEYGITAFVGGGWSGKEITASKALLRLGMMKEYEPHTSGEQKVDSDFQKIRSSSAAVRFGKSKTWRVDDVALSLENKDGAYNRLHFHGGTLKSVLKEELKISSGSVDFKEDECDVILRLAQETGAGEIVLEGKSGYVEGSDVEMEMKLTSATLKLFLGSGIRRMIDGEVSSDIGSLSMKLGDDSVKEYIINVDSGALKLQEFAFLSELKSLMSNDYYSDPKFSNTKGVIEYKNKTISFSELSLEESEKMSITGNVRVEADGSISGALRVGVSYESIADSVNAEKLDTIFTERDGGYAWAETKLSGTLGRPSDSLAEKLSALGGKPIDPLIPAPAPKEKSAQDLFDELNQ